jgi:hypothetical protein
MEQSARLREPLAAVTCAPGWPARFRRRLAPALDVASRSARWDLPTRSGCTGPHPGSASALVPVPWQALPSSVHVLRHVRGREPSGAAYLGAPTQRSWVRASLSRLRPRRAGRCHGAFAARGLGAQHPVYGCSRRCCPSRNSALPCEGDGVIAVWALLAGSGSTSGSHARGSTSSRRFDPRPSPWPPWQRHSWRASGSLLGSASGARPTPGGSLSRVMAARADGGARHGSAPGARQAAGPAPCGCRASGSGTDFGAPTARRPVAPRDLYAYRPEV